ncbi:MAG: hypothetical protein WD772_00620 [Pseudohongiellaceae bacterium]
MVVTLFPQFSEQESVSERLAIEHQHQGMGVAIDEFTAVSQWQGEKMDYDLAVGEMQGLAV